MGNARHKKLNSLVFFAALGLSFSANATDFQSARTIGLGGAGHAAPLLNDSIYMNPSFQSFLPVYSVSTTYQTFSSDGEPYGRSYNVSVQDGRSELFHAGVGYTVRERGAMLHVGASRRIIETLGVGVGGKFFFPSSSQLRSTSSAIFSTSFLASKWLQISLIGDNLFDTNKNRAAGFFREIIVGIKFILMGQLMFYVDPHYIEGLPAGKKFGYEAGVETSLFKDLFARVGTFKNSLAPELAVHGNGFGLGVGLITPRISFDYGFKRTLEYSLADLLPDTQVHVFSMTLFL